MEDAGLSPFGGGTAAVLASADLASLAAGGGHAGGHGATGDCLNCGAALAADARFCSRCGQGTVNHPPSLLEFVHEFVSHYIAVEGTLWKSLWGLMARPGFLTREYLAGRRQRYVLPLRLLLTLGLLFFMALKLMPGSTHTLGLEDEADDKVVQVASGASSAASATSSKMDKVKRKFAERGADLHILDPGLAAELPQGMQDRIHRAEAHWRADPAGSLHAMGATMLGLAPYAVLCSLPFFAGLLKLLFWRQPYGAHFVFAMHLHAAWYGMLLLAVLLPWSGVTFAVWAWSNLYPVIALKRVHEAGWLTTVLRAGLLASLHWVILGLGLLMLTMAGALAGG